MSPSNPKDRSRPFCEILEETPPSKRFLLAANPPARACPADVRYLVEKSFQLRYSDVFSMYRYAKLACGLARALPHQDRESRDANGEACIQFGNTLRILGHFEDSRRSLREAEHWISEGSGRPELLALLWEVRGSLYRDWRNFEASESCLVIARNFHAQAGELGDLDRCLVTRALCAGEGGNAARAVRLSERAAQRINPQKRPDLALSAVHVLCWFLVDEGDPQLARACSVEAESLFTPEVGDLVQIRREWLRGHIDRALGLHLSAEALYRRAANGYAKYDLSYERALVLLDLCLPLAAQNRPDELAAVAKEILPEFERIGIGRKRWLRGFSSPRRPRPRSPAA